MKGSKLPPPGEVGNGAPKRKRARYFNSYDSHMAVKARSKLETEFIDYEAKSHTLSSHLPSPTLLDIRPCTRNASRVPM
jgi:hypothetical protein